MSQETLTVRLKKIHCYQNDEHRYDDVFILHNKKQIWPVDKRHEDVGIGTYDMMVDIKGLIPMEPVVLEIWDHDTFSPNDLYGKVTFVPGFPAGVPYSVDMVPNSEKEIARYMIDWEVVAE
ncbi:C2 domain-containing protein [Reichenbachiella versicolor]|uniref:hypothetical protein n=1 Tax=Reichenbachiella versicolor TaxID=1821036 RepID=UPI000D6DCCA5|nr:hypothetical protein [Reichenbachiella versicolor]